MKRVIAVWCLRRMPIAGVRYLPEFGVPAFGVPAVGVPAVGVPAFGVPAVGVPAFGSRTFAIRKLGGRWPGLPVVFVLLLLVLSSSAVPVSADAYYNLSDYDIHMQVGRDNVYQITETITATFSTARHGIYRDIPTTQYGYRHRVHILSVDNPDTGATWPYKTSRDGDMLSIRIGDPDIFVDGTVRYRIRYTYDASDDRNAEGDEVYFNLIGNGWDADIAHASFRIDMPDPFAADEAEVLAGAAGSTSTDRVSWKASGSTLSGVLTSPLHAFEGMTVWIPLEEGYFSEVSNPSRLPLTIGLLLLHLAALAAALYGMFRDANGHRIVPVLSFEPPDQLNAAEMAYVFKQESVSNRDAATLILGWASLGCLRIEEEAGGLLRSTKLVFWKLKELPQKTQAYERKLFTRFFQHGDGARVTSEDLSERYHSDLNVACRAVAQRFRGEHEILVNKFQSRTGWGVVGQGLLTVISLSLIVNVVLGGGLFFPAALIIGIALVLSLLAMYGVSTMMRGGSRSRRGMSVTGALVVWVVFVALPGVFIVSETLPLFWRGDLLPAAFLPFLCMATVVTLWRTKVYTPYALDLTGRVRGFRSFLETVRRDRLEMLFHEHPEWFYDMLPYAIVFGLTGIWERHMRTLSIPPPDWYHGMHPFTPAHFTRTMRGMMDNAVSTPSSSGSGGGGGSVGGGGGGGGGGSW